MVITILFFLLFLSSHVSALTMTVEVTGDPLPSPLLFSLEQHSQLPEGPIEISISTGEQAAFNVVSGELVEFVGCTSQHTKFLCQVHLQMGDSEEEFNAADLRTCPDNGVSANFFTFTDAVMTISCMDENTLAPTLLPTESPTSPETTQTAKEADEEEDGGLVMVVIILIVIIVVVGAILAWYFCYYRKTKLENWTVEDVASWFKTLQFPENDTELYIKNIRKYAIDGDMLLSDNVNDGVLYDKIQMKNDMHRKKVWTKLEKYNATGEINHIIGESGVSAEKVDDSQFTLTPYDDSSKHDRQYDNGVQVIDAAPEMNYDEVTPQVIELIEPGANLEPGSTKKRQMGGEISRNLEERQRLKPTESEGLYREEDDALEVSLYGHEDEGAGTTHAPIEIASPHLDKKMTLSGRSGYRDDRDGVHITGSGRNKRTIQLDDELESLESLPLGPGLPSTDKRSPKPVVELQIPSMPESEAEIHIKTSVSEVVPSLPLTPVLDEEPGIYMNAEDEAIPTEGPGAEATVENDRLVENEVYHNAL